MPGIPVVHKGGSSAMPLALLFSISRGRGGASRTLRLLALIGGSDDISLPYTTGRRLPITDDRLSYVGCCFRRPCFLSRLLRIRVLKDTGFSSVVWARKVNGCRRRAHTTSKSYIVRKEKLLVGHALFIFVIAAIFSVCTLDFSCPFAVSLPVTYSSEVCAASPLSTERMPVTAQFLTNVVCPVRVSRSKIH